MKRYVSIEGNMIVIEYEDDCLMCGGKARLTVDDALCLIGILEEMTGDIMDSEKDKEWQERFEKMKITWWEEHSDMDVVNQLENLLGEFQSKCSGEYDNVIEFKKRRIK